MTDETPAAKALRELHKISCRWHLDCLYPGGPCPDSLEKHELIDKAIRLAREEEAGAAKGGMEEVAAQARREGIEEAKEAVSCAIQPCGCDPCNKREALEAISDLLEKPDADEG